MTKNKLIGLLAILSTSQVLAEDGIPYGDDYKIILPDMVVTAKGQGESNLETPARIDTIPTASIEARKPRYVGDVLSLVPGVHVREVNPLVPAISLRTAANFSTPYFLSTLDGISIVSSVDYNHHSPSHLPVQNACGSVEVLKGAESVLYGSNAMSGVINVVSPGQKEVEEKGNVVGLEAGQRDFKRLKVASGGKLDEKNSYYVSSTYNTDSGWRDLQDGKNFEIFGKHFHKTDSGNKITTTVLGNILRSHVAGYLTKEKYDSSPKESGLNLSDPFSNYNYLFLSSKLEKPMGDRTQLIVEPYVRYDESDMIAFWNTSTTPEDKSKILTAGLRTSGTHQFDNLELTVGLDSEFSKFSYSEVQTRPTVVGPVWSPGEMPKGTHYDYDVNYLSVSPYAKGSIFLTEKLRLDVGVRGDYSLYDYTNNTTDGDCDSTNNTNGRCGIYVRIPNKTSTFSNIGPKAGMNYQINNSTSLFWNIGQNFKVPNATMLYNLTTSDGTPNLRPEKSLSVEAGYKFEGQKSALSISAYQMEISDQIVRTQGTLNELSTSVNAGKSRHQGVELGAAVSPVSDVRFDVSAAVVKNSFVDYKSGGVDYSGKTESFSPNQIYNARLTYNPRFLKALTTNLDWKRVGSYWVENANVNRQEGYDLFNVSLDYEVSKSVKLNLRAVNLTDTKYPSDVANFGSLFYRPGMPRTIYSGVEIKF